MAKKIVKKETEFYKCSPFRGKCKSYNRPEFECYHFHPHKEKEDCQERDFICGGICRKVTVKKIQKQER